MNTLMSQLVKIRKKKRISYLEIEKQTGIPFTRMQQLESGKASVTVDELEKLLRLYQVSLDRVLTSGRRDKWMMAASAALVVGVLLFCAFHFSPALDVMNRAFQQSASEAVTATNGAAVAQGSPDLAGDGSAESGPAAGPETAGEPGFSDGSHADQGPDAGSSAGPHANSGSAADSGAFPDSATGSAAIPDTAASSAIFPESAADSASAPGPGSSASPAGTDGQEEATVFRFWGNIPYHAERLPEAEDAGKDRVIDVFPVRYLDADLPKWLLEKDPDQLILNFGTSEVWTPTTTEAYEALQRDGYRVIGLGTVPEVYDPLILEAGGQKIGFLSLTGLIHNADEIALTKRVGLPRAYRTDEVTEAVKAAKEKVDYLFVLIDWGKTYGQNPNTSQRLIGKAILQAGGDCVIGNRPVKAQDFVIIDGKPLFYALGHAVADDAKESARNLMVEAEFSGGLKRLSVTAGKLENGVLAFDLTDEDRQFFQDKYGNKASLPKYMELVW